MSSSDFRDTLHYPILFVLVLCIIFVGILAVMFRLSEARIERNQTERYQRLVLGLMAESIGAETQIKPYWIISKYPETYNEYISEIKIPGMDRRIFKAEVKGKIVAYCAQVNGKGLWGSMNALVALNPDFGTLLGFAMNEQMETPGLGARIEEAWFTEQFKNLQLIKTDSQPGDYIIDFEFIPEGKQAASPNQIQQVTGATITSQSVIKMLRTELNLIYANHLKQVQL